MLVEANHMSVLQRRLPIGAERTANGISFRVWAPNCRKVALVLESQANGKTGKSIEMKPQAGGYFAVEVDGLGEGALYRFKLDDDDFLYPDPASRFQPEGPRGPSQVIDPRSFRWTDEDWRGVSLKGQVVYEMHIGTFTQEGTYAAAAAQMEELKRVGITLIEMMPLAEFPGQFGWGYDGVDLYAPTRLYGTPDDLRSFVNRAHELGIGVILDVVYNHLGPDGNFLGQFAKDYFTDRYKCEWGQALNFDGENSQPVREFFINNAGYWIEEFHFDGLRLDATQQIFDSSDTHVIAEIVRRVRQTAGERGTIIIGENEPQDVKMIKSPAEGGLGLDCLWNDDLHHSAMVALTGKNEAYYTDYLGSAQELISAIKYGYLYQGQWYRWQKKRRGTASLRMEPGKMVTFLQNHDQIANSGKGWRADKLTTAGRYKAMTALLLLAPGTPMLFQGQEFASSSPFYYFADHNPELAKLVEEGRRQFVSQFRSVNTDAVLACLPVPHERKTFEASKLDFSDREKHAALYRLTEDLLRIRREDATFSRQERGTVDGAVLSHEAFAIRIFGAKEEDDRLLVINLGRDLSFDPCPEPLLAPPQDCDWQQVLATEDPRYNGCGAPAVYEQGRWNITGHSAVVFKPTREIVNRGS
jgi:maltooligosyltrehalose trehalohydrolase